MATVAFSGLTRRVINAGSVTVHGAEPLIELTEAVIVVTPTPTLIATPVGPTVATAGVDDVQFAKVARSRMLPSLKVPAATNCIVCPRGTAAEAGRTAIETRSGAVTVRMAEPLMEPAVATIMALPGPPPMAKPLLVTGATVESEELQVTVFSKGCVLPSG